MRYFIEFAYNGAAYHGWQKQPDAVTVQGVLEQQLSMVLRTPINLVGAGRTDAGVHARQQFAHFDYERALDARKFIYGLNACLPKAIAIKNLHFVSDEAHARFDAKRRSYEYHIHQFKDPFLNDFSFQYLYRLDVEKMNRAAALLFDYNDFECFSKVKTDVGTFICHILEAQWTPNNGKLMFKITADRFLRNMVRAIVGTLIDVGLGKKSLDDVRRIIESKNRCEAGFSVPAHGLYLTEIVYDYIGTPSPDSNGNPFVKGCPEPAKGNQSLKKIAVDSGK